MAKRYQVNDFAYYREGRLYPPGSVVEIPDGEKPSRYWTEVKDAPAKPADTSPGKPAEVKDKPAKRASDTSPV